MNFAKFLRTPFVTGHHRPATLLKKRLWQRCFPVNFAKFLRTLVTEHLRWLLLYCRKKIAAVKIEKLKAFIIKYYDISKTYSVQFHLFYSVNLSYFYFFHGFQSSILHKHIKLLNETK